MSMSESQKRAQRKYYHKNKEHFHQKNKAYRIKNADVLRQKRQIHALANAHPCEICGKVIYTKGATKCISCSKKGIVGANAYHWKGGRIINQGYIYIYKPDHPNATKSKYVYEHILVWEQTHNKPLPDGWVVHHLNGIKDDNRVKNLLGLP